MSIQNTASLVVMAHDEGRAEASDEFLDLAKRMEGCLDSLADRGYMNETWRRLWVDVWEFIEKAEAAKIKTCGA